MENIEAGIKRQLKWQNVRNKEERDYFLEQIITYCKILKTRPFKQPKSPKTRHG